MTMFFFPRVILTSSMYVGTWLECITQKVVYQEGWWTHSPMWGLSELTETSRWRWGQWTICLRSLPSENDFWSWHRNWHGGLETIVFSLWYHRTHKTIEISKPAPYYFSDTINQVKLQNQHRTTFQTINQLKYDDCSSPWITGKFIMKTTSITTSMGVNGAGRNCGLMPPPPDVLNRSSDRVFSPMSLTEFLLKL